LYCQPEDCSEAETIALRREVIIVKTTRVNFFSARIHLRVLVFTLLAIFLFAAKAGAQNVALNETATRERTASSRRVFVRSKSLLVRAAVVEDKLLKQRGFKELGFVITRDPADADIVLELRHDLLTKYVFSVVDTKTQTVLVSGKLSSLGGTVAGKVAKRFVKEMSRTS
jgi:hypothetical protein